MDALANVDRRANATLLPLATRLGGEGSDPDSVVAILGATSPGDVSAIIRASARSTAQRGHPGRRSRLGTAR